MKNFVVGSKIVRGGIFFFGFFGSQGCGEGVWCCSNTGKGLSWLGGACRGFLQQFWVATGAKTIVHGNLLHGMGRQYMSLLLSGKELAGIFHARHRCKQSYALW